MSTRPLPSRRRALLLCLFATLTVLVCAGLVSFAVLASAPVVAVPFLAAACVGVPMAVALELPPAVSALRSHGQLDRLRRHLASLPETEHPLGL